MKKIFTLVAAIFFSALSQTAVCQWVQTNGPHGGNIYSLAVSGTNIIAGTLSGMFLSSDNGTNWVHADSLSSYTRLVSSNGSNLIFTTDANNNYRSTDFGKNWSEFYFGKFENNGIYSFAFLGNLVFASTDIGVIESTNFGGDWSEKDASPLHVGVTNLIVSKSMLYAITMYGDLYRSADSGTHWEMIFTGNNVKYGGIFTVQGDTILVSLYGKGGGFFLSSNRGNSWIHTDSTYENVDISQLLINRGVYYAATYLQGFLLSNDGGVTFHSGDSGLVNPFITSMAVVDTIVFAGTYSGSGSYSGGNGLVLSSDQGLSWQNPLNAGLSSTPGISCFDTLGKFLFAGTGGGGVFSTYDNGKNWIPLNIGLTDLGISSIIHQNSYMFASTGGGIFRSDDSGRHWIQHNTGLGNDTAINKLLLVGNNLFAAGDYLFRSTDSGMTWVGLTYADENYSNIISVGSYPLTIFRSKKGLFRGTVNGGPWKEVDSSEFSESSVFAQSDGIVYIYSMNQLLRSKDTGSTWEIICDSKNCPNMTDMIIAGTDLYCSNIYPPLVYHSTDSGRSWNNIADGLNDYLGSLTIAGGYLFIGTGSSGVWRRSLSELGVDAKNLSQRSDFSIEQNYPNPFNAITAIRFSIFARNNVTLKVFNNLGTEVSTILSKELLPGEYSIKWDAGNLPHGTYYYRLSTGSSSVSKGMIFLK